MKKTFITLCLFFSSILSLTALENLTAGARARALSNAFVSFSDVWGTFHNPAGIASFKHPALAFSYESRFGLKELSTAAISGVFPANNGTFGLGFYQFGNGSYKENKLGLAYAKNLSEKLSASIQLDYFSQRLPENDSRSGFITFDAGVIYHFTSGVALGSHIFNPVSVKFTENETTGSPTVFRFGGHYNFGNNLIWVAEIEKVAKHPVLLKSGMEFSPAENFFLRLGFSGKPYQLTSGIGFKTKLLCFDLAFGYHGNLGISPAVSIQFNLAE